MRVSEIRVKQIRVNQGLGVFSRFFSVILLETLNVFNYPIVEKDAPYITGY